VSTIVRLQFVLALTAVVLGSAAFMIVRHVERADSAASAAATAQAQKLELEHIDAQAMRNIRIPADFVASTDRCSYPCWVVDRSSVSVARQVPSLFRTAGGVPYPEGRPPNGCRTFHRSAGTYAVCNDVGTIGGQTGWIISNPIQTCVGDDCRIDQQSQVELTLPGMVVGLPAPRPRTQGR
jgi:hypothetical protein